MCTSRVVGQHRHGHVGGIGGDAVLAGAEDRQHAVGAADGRAAGAGVALVAGGRDVAKVDAARALEQVAGRGGGIAQLGRCAGQDGLRQRGIALQDERVMGEIAVAGRGADPQAAIVLPADSVEPQPADDPPTGPGARRRASSGRRAWCRRRESARSRLAGPWRCAPAAIAAAAVMGAIELEGLHGSSLRARPRRTCWIAATMLG